MTGQTSTSISLAWNAATDNVGVCRYEIWRGDVNYNNWKLVGTVTGNTLSLNDINVTRNTTYTYGIRAFDAAGNKSASSNVITASTLS
jgi:chitodextrinase